MHNILNHNSEEALPFEVMIIISLLLFLNNLELS